MVEALRKGGLPARVHPDVPAAIAFSGPLLEMLVISLEIAGWRLRELAPRLGDAVTALREALEVVARDRGTRAPFLLKLVRPWMLRLALPLLKLAPFDVETYVQRHFTKVGDQTVDALDTWIGHAARHQLSSAALTRLRAQLLQARAA